jgi:hypothetical protein
LSCKDEREVNMKTLLQSKKRGSAMPMALVAVMILLAMGVGLLSLGLSGRMYAIRNAEQIEARCAADAGLAMALFEMNENLSAKSLSDSALPQAKDVRLPYCDEAFSYTVSGDLGSGYVVTSIGESGQAERRVRATLMLKGVFNHAILANGTLILKPDTLVDGYNSEDPLDTDTSTSIRTQSTSESSVVLNMGVTVDGDVLVGAGGDPDTVIKDLGATTGNKYGAAEEPLPRITAPTTLLDTGTAITAQGQTVTITPDDSGTYTGINLQKLDVTEVQGEEIVVIDAIPSVLEVSGGDVVLHLTGDIELGNSCEIVVKDGSSLTLYVDKNIHCRNGSAINSENPPEKPTKFQVYGTGEGEQYFDIKAKSNWSGTIYAPNADIDLYAKGDFYGSVVADSFELKAGGNFHYDQALKEVSADDEGVRLVVQRWEEN